METVLEILLCVMTSVSPKRTRNNFMGFVKTTHAIPKAIHVEKSVPMDGSWMVNTAFKFKVRVPTTADFILKVLEVYTHSMETIYLSLVHTGS